jgi:hypothetical protein
MPKGPNGERRPADVIGNAVHVMRIATGEIEETARPTQRHLSGLAGAKARNESLSSTARSEIARKAAAARWS